MSRNFLFAVIGAVAVIGAALGYDYYQEPQQPTGIHITVGSSGVSIVRQ
ncbi:MAG TPA: hypothetical protein VN823_05090 [Stellaceae bacterium]|nr:hypothetical protein [Stellaceae bacterium]